MSNASGVDCLGLRRLLYADDAIEFGKVVKSTLTLLSFHNGFKHCEYCTKILYLLHILTIFAIFNFIDYIKKD